MKTFHACNPSNGEVEYTFPVTKTTLGGIELGLDTLSQFSLRLLSRLPASQVSTLFVRIGSSTLFFFFFVPLTLVPQR